MLVFSFFLSAVSALVVTIISHQYTIVQNRYLQKKITALNESIVYLVLQTLKSKESFDLIKDSSKQYTVTINLKEISYCCTIDLSYLKEGTISLIARMEANNIKINEIACIVGCDDSGEKNIQLWKMT